MQASSRGLPRLPNELLSQQVDLRNREGRVHLLSRPKVVTEVSSWYRGVPLAALLGLGLLGSAAPAYADAGISSADWLAIERWAIGVTPALAYLYFKNVVLKNEPDKIFMAPQVYTFLSVYSLALILVAFVWWRPEYYSTHSNGIF